MIFSPLLLPVHPVIWNKLHPINRPPLTEAQVPLEPALPGAVSDRASHGRGIVVYISNRAVFADCEVDEFFESAFSDVRVTGVHLSLVD